MVDACLIGMNCFHDDDVFGFACLFGKLIKQLGKLFGDFKANLLDPTACVAVGLDLGAGFGIFDNLGHLNFS